MSISSFLFNQNNININHTNLSQNISFELYIHNYIEFNWLLLLSCSLWYCNSKKELEIRIFKIFEILEKLDYVEEQVLYFIFYSLYKYSNISQFIRIFEFIYRFIGVYSYTDLLLLFKKLESGKNSDKNLDINEENNKEIIQKRSFVDVSKYISVEEYEDKLKEEIIFYTEQKCINCGKDNKINISDIINKKIVKNGNGFEFRCKNCDEINQDIDIKISYNLLLSNIKKNKDIKIADGSFSLKMPHILYQEIKNYLINLKDNEIDIDHIFSNQNINFLNFVFYFSLNGLPFDFLIPYEKNYINNNKCDREYFDGDKINKNNLKPKINFNELSFCHNDNLCLDKTNK